MKTFNDYYKIAEKLSKLEGKTICVGVIRHIDTGERLFEGMYIAYDNIVQCIDIERGCDLIMPRSKVYEEFYIAYSTGEVIKAYGVKYAGGKDEKDKVQVQK